MKQIITLAFSDFKTIFRDPSLRSFLFLPVLLFGLIIWAVPALTIKYPKVEEYHSYFLMIAAIENTQMFSFIMSMVLIDEKENDVAKVYGIIPYSRNMLLFARFCIPFLFTAVLNIILFATQPLTEVDFTSNLLISLLTAMIVPIYALSVNYLVSNRIQGMIYIKAMNMLVLIPFAAYFVPEAFQHVFGILPSYWMLNAIHETFAQQNITTNLLIGFCYLSIALLLITKVFNKKHYS